MGSETEPAKALLPYLQRADELQKHEPLVAYYCRLYAMEKGLRIPPKERTKTTNSILVSLMNQLEKDKKSVKLGPEDNLYLEGFASNVFAKADKQDRAGRADLNTAKTFYAASIFFEILYQFGELQPDIEQKQKYAVWKAADIRKALKEGRKPEPGPPGGDKDLTVPSTTTASPYDLGPSDTFPTSQPGVDSLSQHIDKAKFQPPENTPVSPSSYSSAGVPSGDSHQPSSSHRPEDSTFDQPYLHRSFSSEQQPTPQNYPSDEHPQPGYPSHDQFTPSYNSSQQNYSTHDKTPHNYASHDIPAHNYPSHDDSLPQHYPSHESSPSYSYANFQTYPSFNDSTIPTVPGHHPSYYHGSTIAPSYQSAPVSSYPTTAQYEPSKENGTHAAPSYQSAPVSSYPTTAQYKPSKENGTHTAPSTPSAAGYTYDSNYQPPVEKITEAHKAARFAVGALAFDDVPVAVEFLRRSLELLTNPSAETH